MNSILSPWKRTILRALIVSGSGIVLGLILYVFAIFTPTMRAFQFTVSGVTIGVSYAALRSSTPRNGLAALLVWYIIMTGSIGEFNSWLLILNFMYIAGMAFATFVHQRLVVKPFVHGALLRIVLGGSIIATANALIAVLLAIFSTKGALSHIAAIEGAAYHNVQIGALIGLATVSGMELAEYLNVKFFDDHSLNSLDSPPSEVGSGQA